MERCFRVWPFILLLQLLGILSTAGNKTTILSHGSGCFECTPHRESLDSEMKPEVRIRTIDFILLNVSYQIQ